MSELSVEPVSLVERLHSFFHVELPGDPELAGQYSLDPSGTLAEHFTDLSPADLDDAMRLVSDNTTTTYTDFADDSVPQLDGESPYAYAFRANYDPPVADGEVDPGMNGLDAGPDAGIDIDAGHDLHAAMDGGPDFGSGLVSSPDTDPTFEGSGDGAGDGASDGAGEAGDAGAHGDLPAAAGDPAELASHEVGGFREPAPSDADADADAGDTGDAGDGSWDGDLREGQALDADDGHFDIDVGG